MNIEFSTVRGHGVVKSRKCPFDTKNDKNKDPYTCENECGELNSNIGRLPCRLNKHKNITYVYLDGDKYSDENESSKKDKTEKEIADIESCNNSTTYNISPEGKNHNQVIEKIRILLTIQRKIMTDMLGLSGRKPMGLKALSKKYKLPEKGIEELFNEAISRLNENRFIKKKSSHFFLL